MDLGEHQRRMLKLMRSEVSTCDDPYFLAVAESSHLAVLREIALWWRVVGVERYAPLTARLLKANGTLEEEVAEYARGRNVSPFVERLGQEFLRVLSRREGLLGSVARFEYALHRVRGGDGRRFLVRWQSDPY